MFAAMSESNGTEIMIARRWERDRTVNYMTLDAAVENLRCSMTPADRLAIGGIARDVIGAALLSGIELHSPLATFTLVNGQAAGQATERAAMVG